MPYFTIYYPRLAERLSQNGIKVTRRKSIYDENRSTWTCQLDRKAAEIIKDFYLERGKTVPEIVETVLRE